jgi:hypothetical protein
MKTKILKVILLVILSLEILQIKAQNQLLYLKGGDPTNWTVTGIPGNQHEEIAQWTSAGYNVQTMNLTTTIITSTLLNGYQVLRLNGELGPRAMTASEGNAIYSWVQNGGKLLADIGWTNMVPAISSFGVQTIDGQNGGGSGLSWYFHGAPMIDGPIIGPGGGVNSFSSSAMDHPVLTSNNNLNVDYYKSGYPMIVHGEFGNGKIIIVFTNSWSHDQDWETNAYRCTIFEADNLEFLQKCIQYLLPITNFIDSFESGDYIIGGWIINGSVEVSTTSPNQGLMCSKGTNSYSLKKSFNPTLTDNVLTIEYAMKASQVNKYSVMFKVTDINNRMACRVSFINNGFIGAINGRQTFNLMSYTPDMWYSVKVVLDVPAKKYDVYVDDFLVADNFNFYPPYFGQGFSFPQNFIWESFESGNSIGWLDEVTINSGGTIGNVKSSGEIDDDLISNQNNEVKISPNPCRDRVQIQIASIDEPVTFELYAISGEKVMTQTLKTTTNFIETSTISEGLYFAVIKRNGNIQLREKLIITH